jgi:hypothetical protein
VHRLGHSGPLQLATERLTVAVSQNGNLNFSSCYSSVFSMMWLTNTLLGDHRVDDYLCQLPLAVIMIRRGCTATMLYNDEVTPIESQSVAVFHREPSSVALHAFACD